MQSASVLRPFGIDFFCLSRKFLVYNLVDRNLKVKYRRSAAGILWTLLSPMAVASIYFFVFKIILNVKVPHYLAFILSGILAWTFFAQTVLEGMESITSNWGLASKVPVPLQIFPYVGTVTNLVNFLFAVPVIFGACLVSGVPLGFSVLLLPLYIALLFLITYSFSLILAVFMVYFRDLKHAGGLIMQVWFYATPVVYDESLIPEGYRWILWANPLGQIFSGFHKMLVHGAWPAPAALGASVAWAAAFMLAALLVQRAMGRELVEKL